MQALRCEHEDEIQNLHLQNSREDRQRVLLQLQRKGMSDKPKEDQEANLKQVNSHEYEVETYNGRTIKRRRVMFEDPRKHKRYTPEANATASVKSLCGSGARSIVSCSRKYVLHPPSSETAPN